MGKKHLSYPEKERDSEIKRLRDALKRKEKEVIKLKSELRTLEKAFEANIKFLKGKTAKLDLQELLEGANKKQSVADIEKEKVLNFKDLEEKWRCHKCKEGVMKLIVFNRNDGKKYIRSCSNKNSCKNRTEPQDWNESVEGVK